MLLPPRDPAAVEPYVRLLSLHQYAKKLNLPVVSIHEHLARFMVKVDLLYLVEHPQLVAQLSLVVRNLWTHLFYVSHKFAIQRLGQLLAVVNASFTLSL